MINITHHYKSLPCPAPLLRRVADLVYKHESGKSKSSSKSKSKKSSAKSATTSSAVQPTSLILCSDYVNRKLNKKFRGKDKPTDVLSFVYNDPDLLGEVYISLQRADVQARRYGVSYDEELARLLVHGLLHLFGYDHIKKSDREIMEKRESEYLKMLSS